MRKQAECGQMMHAKITAITWQTQHLNLILPDFYNYTTIQKEIGNGLDSKSR